MLLIDIYQSRLVRTLDYLDRTPVKVEVLNAQRVRKMERAVKVLSKGLSHLPLPTVSIVGDDSLYPPSTSTYPHSLLPTSSPLFHNSR
jgi:hypothetical protein